MIFKVSKKFQKITVYFLLLIIVSELLVVLNLMGVKTISYNIILDYIFFNNFLNYLYLITLFCTIIFLVFNSYRKKEIKKRPYDFKFYLKDSIGNPIVDQSFVIYPKNKRQAVQRQGHFYIPTSQINGRVSIRELTGGTYYIALRESPRTVIGCFGVFKLKQKQMVWIQTTSPYAKVTVKNRRNWMTLFKSP